MAIMLNAQYLEKKIDIENLNYWNVELQEPYFSYKEAFQKKEKTNKK
jgi:hypothetical protein